MACEFEFDNPQSCGAQGVTKAERCEAEVLGEFDKRMAIIVWHLYIQEPPISQALAESDHANIAKDENPAAPSSNGLKEGA